MLIFRVALVRGHGESSETGLRSEIGPWLEILERFVDFAKIRYRRG